METKKPQLKIGQATHVCLTCQEKGHTRITQEIAGVVVVENKRYCSEHGRAAHKVVDYQRVRGFLMTKNHGSDGFYVFYGICLDFIKKYGGHALVKAIDKIDAEKNEIEGKQLVRVEDMMQHLNN